jgi:23S rRNA pseudouridine2605 synthase
MPRKHATKKRSAKKKAAPRADSTQRLQRLLASAGFGSRRQCEDLIEAGRVDVDGAVVTKLGTTVDSDAQKVRVDGVLLKQQKLVYFAVNKPIGVVTTNRDPQGRPRVVDLVPPNERVFPVGRLDRSSEGLILLTNDGELAQRLTHPKFGVRKVYRVTVAGKVDSQTMKRMREGIYIAEGLVRVDGAKLLKTRSRSTEMEIVLREGKNREIRRILANLGHKVQRLRRIAVGPLKLGEVPPGAYRTLSREEIKKLWAAADESTESVPKRRAVKKRAAKGRTGPQRPSKAAKKPATRQPASRSKQPTGAIAAAGSRATGSVIGGDDTASSETTSRPTKSTKRPRKSATGKGRGTKRSVAGKQSKQDRPKRGRERVTATGKRGGSKATARRGKKRN